MISIIQILSVIFGLFMLYVIHIHKKRKYLDPYEAFFWIFLWVSFIYIAIFPQTFKGLVQRLQIARVFDLLVIIAFMVIAYLTFQNRVDYKNQQKKIEEVIRKRSINETNTKTPKN